jgi:hypothetical protein
MSLEVRLVGGTGAVFWTFIPGNRSTGQWNESFTSVLNHHIWSGLFVNLRLIIRHLQVRHALGICSGTTNDKYKCKWEETFMVGPWSDRSLMYFALREYFSSHRIPKADKNPCPWNMWGVTAWNKMSSVPLGLTWKNRMSLMIPRVSGRSWRGGGECWKNLLPQCLLLCCVG